MTGPAARRSDRELDLHEARANVRPLNRPPPVTGPEELPLAGVAVAFRGFLESLGLDLADPNLAGTDERVARAYQEMFGGLRSAEPELTTFPNSKNYRAMVSVTDIPFYSICAHHFLPFFGAAHVAYMPGERLIGLSKLARAVDHYARRPQIQESLTEEVATLLDERLAPSGLIVSLEARHLCMEMRGVTRPGAVTTTMAVRGTFQNDGLLQQQFFERLRRPGAIASGGELRY